jgi:hypothetical protein
MKKSLLFFSALIIVIFYSFPSKAQTNVIINEFSQGDIGDHEWIELVATADGTDLSGLYITTSSANKTAHATYDFPSSADLTVGFQLKPSLLYSNLLKGQAVVIYKHPTNDVLYDAMIGGTGDPGNDLTFSDGNGILIASDNSTYINGVWPGMKNYKSTITGDNIGIFSTSGGGFTGVFGISYGDSTALPSNPISGNYGTVTVPSLYALAAGQELAYNASSLSQSSLDNYSNWLKQASTSATPKTLNGGSNNTLPVELASFSASVKGSTVQLTWSTATEVNNYGFDVERSSGNSGWQKIGFVAGAGNSNSPKDYSFTDNPSGGTSFSYRLRQIDVAGSFKYYDAVTVNLTLSDEPQLLQNSPNPFNPSTSIKFYIPNNSDVSIKIYDVLGREVTTLVNQQTTAGYHIVYWNGKDSRGEDVSSGIYLYRLTAGSISQTKKMNLLK